MDSVLKEGGLYTKTLTLNNGVVIPQIGFGCYQVKESDPFYWALKYGYKHLDSAALYKNEAQVGQELKRAIADFGIKREDIFITSKVFFTAMGYELTKKSIEESLEKFDIGPLDMMLIHFPGTKGLEKNDPQHKENRAGSWKALEEAVQNGQVKSIGVSNFRPEHLDEIIEIAKIKPAVNQFELHPMYVEYDTIESCNKHGILVQAYSPFAQFNKELIDHPTIQTISKNNNIDTAKVILLWHLAKGWCVLPKSATEERIRQNILLDGLSLTAEEVSQIDELGKTHRLKICWDPKDYA